MVTSAISAGDLVKLRGEGAWLDELALHVTPLVSVASAEITAVQARSPFTELTVTWDGAYSAVSLGQLVKIMDGTTLKAYAVIRKAPTATKCYISETPIGSAGTATRIENIIAVGDTVTVYNHRPLWGMYSTIQGNIFYKQWDLPYTDQNESPPPVANTGMWQAARIAVGDAATFTLPRGGVNTSFALGAATISSYAWVLPSGVSLVSGYALSDDVIEVEADAGAHLVKLTVTDSNSKTHAAYVWLFVSDGSTGASLSERYGFRLESDSQSAKGREITFRAFGTGLEALLYPSAGILLREWNSFSAGDVSEGVLVDTFIGYVRSIEWTYDANDIPSALVEAVSPMIYAEGIVQPQQSLTEESNASNWAECSSVLSNPRGQAYYAIKWHSPSLLDMHDFDAPYSTPRRKYFNYPSKSLASALELVAEGIAGKVGSASDGTTVLRKNPLYMGNTDRNSLITRLTWLAQDILPPLQYEQNRIMRYRQAKSGALTYNGTSVKAFAVMKRWYQGVGETELPAFAVTVAEGVTRAKEVVGHYIAEQNRDIESITLELTRNQDVIDPAYWLWNGLTISADYDAAGVGFSASRWLATRISRTWEQENGDIKKRISVQLQAETFGLPGEEIILGSASAYSTPDGNTTGSGIAMAYQPKQNSILGGGGLGGGIGLAVTDNGKLAWSANLLDANPSWTELSAFFSGVINDACFDYNSAFFLNGYSGVDKLGMYVVTTNGSTVYIYRIEDAKVPNGSPLLIAQASMADDSCVTGVRIESSDTTPTLVLVAWHSQTGLQFTRTTDGGASWSAVANVDASITDTANDNAALGLAIRGVKQLISAPNSDENYGLYLASTAGGSFSAVASTERRSVPFPLIKADDSNAYASVPQDTTKTYQDFDGGGITYALGGTGSPSVAAGGVSGNCAKVSGSGFVAGNLLTVTLTFAPMRVYDVRLKAYASFNSTHGDNYVNFQLKNNGNNIIDSSSTQAKNLVPNTGTWTDVSRGTPFYNPLSAYDFQDGAIASAWCDEIVITFGSTTASTTAWDYRIDDIEIWAYDMHGNTAVDFEDNEEYSLYALAVDSGDTLTRSVAASLGYYAQVSSRASGASATSFIECDIDLGTSKKIRGVMFVYYAEKRLGTPVSSPEAWDNCTLEIYDGGVQQWDGAIGTFRMIETRSLNTFIYYVAEPFFQTYPVEGVTGDQVVLKLATSAYDGDRQMWLERVIVFEDTLPFEGVFFEDDYGLQTITNSAENLDAVVIQNSGSTYYGAPTQGKCYRGTAASSGNPVQIETDIQLPEAVTIDDLQFWAYGSTSSVGEEITVECDLYIVGSDTPLTFTANADYEWRQFGGRVHFGWTTPYTVNRIVLRVVAEGGGTDYDLRLDSILWWYWGGYRLYKIADYGGTPAWSDITPDESAPSRPHDLALGQINTDKLNMVDNEAVWYESANQGTAWTEKEVDSSKRVFLQQGQTYLAAGVASLAQSVDGGVVFADKSGNLQTVLGDNAGSIKRLLVL